MRINVYEEELTGDTVAVEKQTTVGTFYGLRIMLRSSTELQNASSGTGRDERSAITYWFRDKAVRDRFGDGVVGPLLAASAWR